MVLDKPHRRIASSCSLAVHFEKCLFPRSLASRSAITWLLVCPHHNTAFPERTFSQKGRFEHIRYGCFKTSFLGKRPLWILSKRPFWENVLFGKRPFWENVHTGKCLLWTFQNVHNGSIQNVLFWKHLLWTFTKRPFLETSITENVLFWKHL